MTRLILNCPHTHAGRHYAPGETLEVDAPTADWLIGQGVAQPDLELAIVQANPEPDPKAKPRSATLQRQEPQP